MTDQFCTHTKTGKSKALYFNLDTNRYQFMNKADINRLLLTWSYFLASELGRRGTEMVNIKKKSVYSFLF
jgi:hypothetical protein